MNDYKELITALREEADVVDYEKYRDVVYKLECLLCYATGNRYSKSEYSLQDMERMVDDYVQQLIDEATENTISRDEYERVCKERDAAISDLTMCMYFSTKNNNVCNFCKKDMAEYPNKCAGWSDSCECNPEWRGTSKEEDDGQSIL